ncbi:hypothetical protein [Pyxidicoccus xibeiensis]|uniref:hypothetical protein n=1 Tax=Pyxidicoccus xibeiensis TaxID=2906759 RepID=UPI0020A6DF6C|nr:hypothetical protein [Pyxidicoccus xibeiensis]MCP3139794.1 hypothetical protein [Pyxidicoccus xibeiensis]
MSTLRALACILVLGSALAYTGCSDDLDDKPGTGPFPVPDAGTPDAGAPDAGEPDAGTEVTTLVRDLIENQTTETGTPVETETRNLVDTAPTGAFPDAFFQ